MERKVLLWLFNYGVFKDILCIFQTWKWSTITEGENKGKRRMWRLNFWIATDGEEDILCCCFLLFLSTYMFTFLFDKLNISVHFQLLHVFCLSIHVYVNIHFIDLRSYFLMHILMYIDYLFHCQRLATRSKSTILIVLKCLQTEVCSGKTTIIYQLEGSG